MSEGNSFEQYFAELHGISAKLATIGITVFDDDLLEIVMKIIHDSYNHFMQHYIIGRKFLGLIQLQKNLMHKESGWQIKLSKDASILEALYFCVSQYKN